VTAPTRRARTGGGEPRTARPARGLARPGIRPARAVGGFLLIAALLTATSVAVAALEAWVGVADASAAYIPAVVLVAASLGTLPAVATSVASFLVYDFFFVAPTMTFTVEAPTEWLSLLLFLLVAVVVGRLTALLADREREATQRAREAGVLFGIGQDLANAPSVPDGIGRVVERLLAETRMSRVWCGLGPSVLDERTVADTARGSRRPPLGSRFVLEREAGGGLAWVRVREPTTPGAPAPATDDVVFRVPLVSGGATLGSLWAARPRSIEPPTDGTTRTLVAAADQVAGALERDRLGADATAAAIARESDALKSALLDSVSHDLRTPLVSIRVAAGHLADPSVEMAPEAIRASARSIEGEAARLDRLVANVLDLSRIEAGALRPTADPYDLGDLVSQVVDRLAPLLAGDTVRVEVPADLPPVLVDPILADQIVANLLENAVAHAGPGRVVRVAAAVTGDGAAIELVVEDSGAGVPPRDLPHLFEKFYRGPASPAGGRGMGIGLAVVRGLAETMGGTVAARRSALGGLAIAVTLPAAPMPDEP
jgi:two-component system sensor histidine kinase KdpD